MTPRTSPKDFFMHLAAVAFLYAAVVALISLAFAEASRVLPDALQTFYGVGDLVWPISVLIVLVPAVYVFEWLIARDIGRMPEKRDIWVRRWRIYLTLFLTGVTILVDLIVLVNTYLNGEVTGRFIVKVGIVLLVSAVVFTYYILAKNAGSGSQGAPRAWRRALAWTGAVIVLAAIVVGFVIVGSPATQRSIRFDEERVSDLSSIQYQAVSYWQRTGQLPASLEALNSPLDYFKVPADPETGASYRYAVKGPMGFELCATFDLDSAAALRSGGGVSSDPLYAPASTGHGSDWTHAAGPVCFDRTIDPKLYPAPTPAPTVLPSAPVPAK